MYASKITKTMRTSIEESNYRRDKQIRYNMEHQKMPRQAHKSGNAQELIAAQTEVQSIAADTQSTYDATADIDTRIAQARADMERAAKSLDFLAAARYRDLMYELQKQKSTWAYFWCFRLCFAAIPRLCREAMIRLDILPI